MFARDLVVQAATVACVHSTRLPTLIVLGRPYITFFNNWIEGLQSYELHLILLLECLDELLRWNLLERQREVHSLVNGLSQPLLRSEILVRQPKFLELFVAPLGNFLLLTKPLPKLRLVQILGGIGIDNGKELYAFYYCELLLFTNIQLFAIIMLIVLQKVITFLIIHLVATGLLRRLFIQMQLICDPCADIYWTLVEISLFQFLCELWLDLVCVALVLVNHETAIGIDDLLQLLVVVAAFGYIEHYISKELMSK